MLVIFTVILLGLLVLGLPVAFSLGTAGLFGMFAFMGGGSSLAQIPILAYKSLDDFVLTAVPLYILMSQILLTQDRQHENICGPAGRLHQYNVRRS